MGFHRWCDPGLRRRAAQRHLGADLWTAAVEVERFLALPKRGGSAFGWKGEKEKGGDDR